MLRIIIQVKNHHIVFAVIHKRGCRDGAGVQIEKRIGEKVKAVRLKQNITQDSLAKSSSISLSSVKKVEAGKIGSFDTLLRILRTLGMLDELSHLCEEEQMSPSEYFDMVNSAKKGRRKRAVGTLKKDKEESEW